MLPTRFIHLPRLASSSRLPRHHACTGSAAHLVGRQPFSLSAHRCAAVRAPDLVAKTPLAEQLMRSGLWGSKTTRDESASKPGQHLTPKFIAAVKKTARGDKSRVNVVSEKLCDDILSYVGHSLERHKGCDIIDMYPGAGLWSSKLHDFLKPRSHILLEPDDQLYTPFLEPLLEKPGVKLIPKTGIIWKELNTILTPEFLPHQKTFAPGSDELLQRNDTLILTANLAFHPKKRFGNFSSIVPLVLHQFLGAIRSSSLFQRYGLVRMLIWTRNDDKAGLIPRCMQKRRREAVEAELACEWAHEICGLGGAESVWHMRETALEEASLQATVLRMRDAGIVMPEGRAGDGLKRAQAEVDGGRLLVPGSEPPMYARPYREKLAKLVEANEQQAFEATSEQRRLLLDHRWRGNGDSRKHQQIFEWRQSFEEIVARYRSGSVSADEASALATDWVNLLTRAHTKHMEFSSYRENLRYFHQDPPMLHWDRRHMDPMVVEAQEFLPNIECSLLDLQPKATHPLLRPPPVFPPVVAANNRSSDSFDLIIRHLMSQPSVPIRKLLEGLWPGAGDFIVQHCKGFHDPKLGGLEPIFQNRFTEMSPRMMNPRHFEEVLELWMQWPFRPDFQELVARTTDDDDENSGRGSAGATGVDG